MKMAHRVNMLSGKKEPKPHASERTWSRWRGRRNIETKQDEVRRSRIEEVKQMMREKITWLGNLQRRALSDHVVMER